MQNFELRLLGLGYNQFYQANVQVYYNNCLIFEDRTYNGCINFCLEKGKIYKFVICFNGIKETVIICINCPICVINLNQNNKSSRIITFLLTDLNYNNLPIERGELTFG